MKESPENLKRLKKDASKPLKRLNETDLEIDIDDVYRPSSVLDMPIRPTWSYEMSREQLEEQEKKYFSVGLLFHNKFEVLLLLKK